MKRSRARGSAISRRTWAHRAARLTCVAAAIGLFAGTAFAEMLEEGAAMPAWSLRDQTGTEVRSDQLAGKTYLLWFYPKAQTPGCTAEGQALRDAYGRFEAAGVEILGVSFDDPAANAAFVEAESFPFRLLSDDGTLAVAVGAADPGGAKYARRISYLVGPDGRVRHAYANVVPAAHAGQVLADLAGAKPES